MDCGEYERALRDLGVNPRSASDGVKNNLPAPFHKAGDTFVQVYPANVLTEAQRKAFIDELKTYLAALQAAAR